MGSNIKLILTRLDKKRKIHDRPKIRLNSMGPNWPHGTPGDLRGKKFRGVVGEHPWVTEQIERRHMFMHRDECKE